MCSLSTSALPGAVQSATEELERLEHAFDRVKKQLFDRLHGILREQLFHDAPASIPVTAVATAGKREDRGATRHPRLRVHAISSDSDDDDDEDDGLQSRLAQHVMENNGS